MNKKVRLMLKEAGVLKRFRIMLLLRSPFDILNSVLTANLISVCNHFALLFLSVLNRLKEKSLLPVPHFLNNTKV